MMKFTSNESYFRLRLDLKLTFGKHPTGTVVMASLTETTLSIILSATFLSKLLTTKF